MESESIKRSPMGNEGDCSKFPQSVPHEGRSVSYVLRGH
jgi:hypothetical protein